MARRINGKIYYRTSEACKMAGISKATLFRRFSEGIIDDTAQKDENGWRLFSEEDIERIKSEAPVSLEIGT